MGESHQQSISRGSSPGYVIQVDGTNAPYDVPMDGSPEQCVPMHGSPQYSPSAGSSPQQCVPSLQQESSTVQPNVFPGDNFPIKGQNPPESMVLPEENSVSSWDEFDLRSCGCLSCLG